MIHIIHTPAAVLARRRIWQLARCAACVGTAGACLGILAQRVSILEAASGCNFHGVHYYPPEEESEVQEDDPATSGPSLAPPPIPALPLALPECSFDSAELSILPESKGSDELPLESDADALASSRQLRQETVAKPPSEDKEAAYIPPDYLNCPKPPYPPRLRHRRLQGSVEVLISISETGVPTQVEVTRSSGSRLLDQHTHDWILQHWTFRPARNGSEPAAAQVRTSIVFSLHAS